MRQVPTYYIVGDGKMASHFIHYLKLLSLPYQQWSRRSTTSFSDFAGQTKILYLLIRDQALTDYFENPVLAQHQLLHFAASVSHPRAHCLHPLMTFGRHLYPLEVYQQIPFIIDPSLDPKHCLPGLDNPCFQLSIQERAYYHSMLVLGGNASQILWGKMQQECVRLGIPAVYLNQYLQRALDNFKEDGIQSLTGPLARQDERTISQNLNALIDDPFHAVYQSFVDTYREEENEKYS